MDEDREQGRRVYVRGESGYWRCPLCGAKNGEHAVDCWMTDDSLLEWIEL